MPPSRLERQPIIQEMLYYIVKRVEFSFSAEFTLCAVIRDPVILATFAGSRVSGSTGPTIRDRST